MIIKSKCDIKFLQPFKKICYFIQKLILHDLSFSRYASIVSGKVLFMNESLLLNKSSKSITDLSGLLGLYSVSISITHL